MLRLLKRLVPQRSLLRLSWHRAKAFCAALRYGFPARKLTVIGITGTDGKTTTVGMTAHILERSGIAVGAMSTAFFQVRDDISWNETQKTSPSPFVVQGFLRELRPEDLAGSAGSFQLRAEILRRVNLIAAPGKVDAVLIEEMLVQ